MFSDAGATEAKDIRKLTLDEYETAIGLRLSMTSVLNIGRAASILAQC